MRPERCRGADRQGGGFACLYSSLHILFLHGQTLNRDSSSGSVPATSPLLCFPTPPLLCFYPHSCESNSMYSVLAGVQFWAQSDSRGHRTGLLGAAISAAVFLFRTKPRNAVSRTKRGVHRNRRLSASRLTNPSRILNPGFCHSASGLLSLCLRRFLPRLVQSRIPQRLIILSAHPQPVHQYRQPTRHRHHRSFLSAFASALTHLQPVSP